MPCFNVRVFIAVEQLNPVMIPTGKMLLVRIQVCPPMFIAKLAVPVFVGVPEMVYDKVPSPVVKFPADNEAVKPVTPVEVMVCKE